MQFMQGRYGMDRLNQVLIFASLFVYAVSLFLRKTVYPYAIVRVIYILMLAAVLLRMFSKNLYKRRLELERYMRLENGLTGWWRRLRSKANGNVVEMKSRRQYKYLTCPQCMQRLRVPRGKGRLRVTCTKCGCRFETKS